MLHVTDTIQITYVPTTSITSMQNSYGTQKPKIELKGQKVKG